MSTSFHAGSGYLFPPPFRCPCPRFPATRPAVPAAAPTASAAADARQRRATAQAPRPEQARQPSSAVARAAGTHLPPLCARRTPRQLPPSGPRASSSWPGGCGWQRLGYVCGAPLRREGLGRTRWAVAVVWGRYKCLCGKTGSKPGVAEARGALRRTWEGGERCRAGTGAQSSCSRVTDAVASADTLGMEKCRGLGMIRERERGGLLALFVCEDPSVIAAVPLERLEVKESIVINLLLAP